jgi:dipeptidase
MKNVRFVAALLLLSTFNFQLSTIRACTNFLVGKKASADGSTIISYAADSYSLYGFLRYSPAADYPAGATREVVDWDTGKPLGRIPQVAHTYSVIGNQNEHQLTIGETTWGGREELEGDQGIDYGSLIYIALERCKTAREAIRCITTLASTYGYASSGETFSIGDPNEIWIMDLIGTGKGKNNIVWVATRVPDDMICAHANQARITHINFKDKKNWLYSKNVVSFARQKGYFKGKDADFSFQAAYNPFDLSGLYVCETRVWSFFRHFSGEMDQYYDYATGKRYLEMKQDPSLTEQAINEQMVQYAMPLFIRPDRKVSAQDIKDCMRDEYQGTPLDITQGTAAGPWNSKLRYGSLKFELDSATYWYQRPTATQQTAWSFVAQMRNEQMVNGQMQKCDGILWFGVDDAACSCYIPFYSRTTVIPEAFREGNGDLYTYTPTSAWWQFNLVANWAYTKYSRMKPYIAAEQAQFDRYFLSLIPKRDAELASLSAEEAQQKINEYAEADVQKVMKTWRGLYTYLTTKFIDGQERKEEDGRFKRNDYGEPASPDRPAYPDAYLRTITNQTIHE